MVAVQQPRAVPELTQVNPTLHDSGSSVWHVRPCPCCQCCSLITIEAINETAPIRRWRILILILPSTQLSWNAIEIWRIRWPWRHPRCSHKAHCRWRGTQPRDCARHGDSDMEQQRRVEEWDGNERHDSHMLLLSKAHRQE